jgi:hypothetical protein
MKTTHSALEDKSPVPLDNEFQALITQPLLRSLARHRPLILEYALLAIQNTLTDEEANRLGEIFDLATEDSVLSFGLEEVDHLVAHHLGLINGDFIKDQQDKFRRSIGQSWIDSLWQDLQSRVKVLQVYLQRLGVYHGSIDGEMGSATEAAIHRLRQQQPSAIAGVDFI